MAWLISFLFDFWRGLPVGREKTQKAESMEMTARGDAGKRTNTEQIWKMQGHVLNEWKALSHGLDHHGTLQIQVRALRGVLVLQPPFPGPGAGIGCSVGSAQGWGCQGGSVGMSSGKTPGPLPPDLTLWSLPGPCSLSDGDRLWPGHE